MNQPDDQIRLLNLEPADQYDSAVHCSLETVEHDDSTKAPDYEALSYIWGDAKERRFIQVNGCPFQVTANLEFALRYLRLPSVTRVLWIDAICINQRDLSEKTCQVRRLRQNYFNAARVLVWSGEASDDLNPDQQLDDTMNFLADSGPDNQDEFFIYMSGVRKLLQKPWWSRMWVVQELFAAQQPPRVGFKQTWMEWNAVEKAVENLQQAIKHDLFADVPRNATSLINFGIVPTGSRDAGKGESWTTLHGALRATCDRKASIG